MTLELTTEFTATQIGRQKIQITGENLTDKVADYVIKKGNSSVAIASVSVSADKKTAQLTTVSSTLATGKYSASFGKSDAYDFDVEAEKIDKVEIVGTDLVVANAGAQGDTATIKYRIINQFGEKMNGSVNATCSLGSTGVAAATRTTDGTVTVTLAAAATLDVTTGTLVLVDSTTGKSATAVVKVGAKVAINKVEVLGVYKTSGTTPEVATINTGDTASDFSVLFKAYDQYGVELKALPVAGTTVTVSGNTGLDKGVLSTNFATVKVGDETYFKIPLTAASLTAGTSTMTIVGNSVGLLASVDISVKEKVAVSDITIAMTDTLYVGTKTEVEYSAVDTNGDAVTSFDTLNALGTTPFNGNTDFAWERQNDGTAKLYLTPSQGQTFSEAAPTGTNSVTAVINVQVGTNVHTSTVKVYAQKTSTAIIGIDEDVATAALLGEAITFKQEDLIIQDQYGNVKTDDEVAADTLAQVIATKDSASTGFGAITTGNTAVAISGAKTTPVFAITADTETAGTAEITLKLQKRSNNSDIDNSDCLVTLRSTTIENVKDVTIKELPPLYVLDADGNNGNTANKDYLSQNVPLEVTGKLDGLTVNIPHTSYNVVSSTDHIAYSNGNISAKGATVLKDDKETSTTETLEIVLKDKAGTSVKQDVTISSIAPEVASVKKSGTSIAVSKKNSGHGASATIGYSDIVGSLEIEDQYKGYAKKYDGSNWNTAAFTADTPRVLFSNIPEGFTVAGNNTASAALTVGDDVTAKTYTVDVTLTYASGVTFSDTVVITVGASGTIQSANVTAPSAATVNEGSVTNKEAFVTAGSGSVSIGGSPVTGTFAVKSVVCKTAQGGAYSVGDAFDTAKNVKQNEVFTVTYTFTDTAGDYAVYEGTFDVTIQS